MRQVVRSNSDAFSILESLVAFAVLLILLLILLSMTNSTMLFTKLSQRRMDSSSTLRAAMDRVAMDIGSAVLREDLPPLFVRSSSPEGSDEIYLHSQAEGYEGERGISVIGYRIHEGKLERGAQGTGWTSDPPQFAHSLATNSIRSQNFDVAAEKIFRLKIEFLGTNGLLLTNSVPPSSWSEVRAVVVNMAAVDARAMKVARGSQEELASLLPGWPAAQDEGIISTWQKTLDSSDFLSGDERFPKETRRSIEVRRRIIPVWN